jgi:hypothetical protein
MKPARILIAIVLLMLVAGWTLWAVSGSSHALATASVWLLLGAFAVLCAPLLFLGVVALLQRLRGQ